MFEIKGSDIDNGAIAAGADLVCEYEVLDSVMSIDIAILLFVACMLISPSRKLYATMFVLSLAMELYGTWIGNWAWAPRVPWLGLATINPPIAAGAFYCVLDLLVVMATGKNALSLRRVRA